MAFKFDCCFYTTLILFNIAKSQMCHLGNQCGLQNSICVDCISELGINTYCNQINHQCCLQDYNSNTIMPNNNIKCNNNIDCCNYPNSICTNDGICTNCISSGM